MTVNPTLYPIFVFTSNWNVLWSPFRTDTDVRILSYGVMDSFKLCSVVTGIRAKTRLGLPYVSKFLSVFTQLHPSVICRNPRLISTTNGDFDFVFLGTIVFSGNPSNGPKRYKFNFLDERIVHQLSCLCRSNVIPDSARRSAIILNVQYPSSNNARGRMVGNRYKFYKVVVVGDNVLILP